MNIVNNEILPDLSRAKGTKNGVSTHKSTISNVGSNSGVSPSERISGNFRN